MHLPDGFLSPPVWAGLDLLALATLAACVRRLKARITDETVPRMGMLGAFVFAAQMVNVPVAAGTSGHLLGGVLVASLVGPEIRAIQSHAVLACIKHYILNNQEYLRNSIDVHVDQRTLQEIYLPPFAASVREGGVAAAMGSYNSSDVENEAEK